MDEHRRDFLKQMTTLAAAGMPIVTVAEPLLARAGEAQRRSGMKTSYDPAAMFELKVSDVEFRRTPAGRQLMARIYQPQGTGPFPTMLDLHPIEKMLYTAKAHDTGAKRGASLRKLGRSAT